MSRERGLRQRLQVLGTLHEAVNALRSLSAQHFRSARAALPAARAYRTAIEDLLGVLPAAPEPASDGAPDGVVLVAADLGLCGDYVTRLAAEAVAARRALGPGPLWCVGRRAVRPLARAGATADRVWDGAASTGALPHLLVDLVNAIVAARDRGQLGALVLVAARFEGAGHFRPVRVPLLPIRRSAAAPPLRGSRYVRPAHLAAVVVREFLYVVLHETLLDALAAEHGKRLVTSESARTWLEERMRATTRRLAALRRETTTEEVLEVAAGARALRAAEA